MAVQDGYGKSSGSESLVFAYDLKDTVNSFRGEPATNSQNADISSMTQVGFDSWSCYDGSPPYHTWGTNQSKTFVTIPGPFGTSVNAMLYHNFNGGFYGPTDWGAVPNGTITAGRTYTVQGWVKAADSSSIGKTVTPYTYYSHSGGAYSAGTNYTLTDQWQLVSHTHTVQYNASGDGIMYFFTQNSGEVKMHLTMTGVFLDESHAVPWIIGGSTRSNTQGLLDLTGNNTIDLSNVSFDSNAQMTFDGTDDFITAGNNSHLAPGTGNFTYSCWMNPVGYSYYAGLLVVATTGGLWIGKLGSNMVLRAYNVEDYLQHSTLPTVGQWTNVVITRNGTTVTLYYNANSVATATTGYNFVQATAYIGNDGPISSANFNGKITNTFFFNRALTSTEITNNYLKYKRQYGLT